jgi:uncharacterized iron-regulated membrane protein
MFYYALVFIIFLMAPAILGVILGFDLQIDAWINVIYNLPCAESSGA